MYVWRLPLFAFATIATTALVLLTIAAVLLPRARLQNAIAEVACSIAGGMVLGSSPAIVDWMTAPSAAPRWIYATPPIAAMVIAWLAPRCSRRTPAPRRTCTASPSPR